MDAEKKIKSLFGCLGILLFLTSATPLFGADGSTTEKVIVGKILDFRNPLPRHLTCVPGTNQLFVYHVNQKPNAVYQWDISRKRLLKTYLLGDGFNCDKIRVSPNGRFTVIACRSYNSNTELGFAVKALLIDNPSQKVVRTIPIHECIYDVQFSTNAQSFLLTTIFQEVLGFDTTGERIARYDVAEYRKPASQKVWEIGEAKGRDHQTVGIYYRDELGREHRLYNRGVGGNYVITKDNRYLAAGSRGELIIWRLDEGQQVFQRTLSKRGCVAYCAEKDLILWADYNEGTELLGIKIEPKSP